MSSTSPSTMFLFDKFSTGRLKYGKGILEIPELVWRFRLRSFPEFAPESTAAFDDEMNIYFGSHDQCFYSLTAEGTFRWMFKTGGKVYSSPTLLDSDHVCVASGDGLSLIHI